jgi:hypothetical protein
MPNERALYVERTPWPGWVRAIYWGVVGLVCFALLAGWDTTLPPLPRVLLAVGVGGAALGLHALLGGLTVQVHRSEILIHLGSVPLVRRRVPLTEVLGSSSVQYEPIAEFGGWGIRGTAKRRAWTARGDRAVSLELSGGRQLLIGSDRPHRLEDRIRSAVADHERRNRSD